MRKSTKWIFKFCAGGALGLSAAAYMSHHMQESKRRHDAIELSLAQGMMQDFMKCANERIGRQSAFWMMPPVTSIQRRFGEKDGYPSLEGGMLRLETALPDHIKGNIAVMVTDVDRKSGQVTKYSYNYVGSIHKTQHEAILRAASSCLNARGPMA